MMTGRMTLAELDINHVTGHTLNMCARPATKLLSHETHTD